MAPLSGFPLRGGMIVMHLTKDQPMGPIFGGSKLMLRSMVILRDFSLGTDDPCMN